MLKYLLPLTRPAGPLNVGAPMTKVVVGMSGGVDSSVAALILKEQGYDVMGVSMRLWADARAEGATNTCCSCVDQQDAARVCNDLGIPFYPISLTEIFRAQVVENFVSEYKKGRTPSPCVMCNNTLKFGELFKIAEKLGGEKIATGHYARVTTDAAGRHHLLAATDAAKDQSYFLFMLDQDRLSRTLFPLGDMNKEQVRAMARRFGIHTAAKPDSQGLCFVPDGDYAGFIERESNAATTPPPGMFVDSEGNVLGPHEGIHHYTVGQRRGLRISANDRRYVSEIRPETNEVVLGEWDQVTFAGFTADGVNWIAGHPMALADKAAPLDCLVRFRYRLKPTPATVVSDGNGGAQVRFASRQRAVAPGQAAVFYQGDEVLGGGWIK